MKLVGTAAAERALMRILTETAGRGEICPTNPVLADRLALSSPSGPVRLMKALERKGLIAVDRFAAGRQVTILATGKVTRHDGSRVAHFSLSRAKSPPRPKTIATDPVCSVVSEEVDDLAIRRAAARSTGTIRSTIHLTLERPAPAGAPTLGQVDRRPPAFSREPCCRCGVRGDLGCAHQQPFVPEAAA